MKQKKSERTSTTGKKQRRSEHMVLEGEEVGQRNENRSERGSEIMKRQRRSKVPLLDGEEIEGNQKGFFACYLLCSMSPRFKGHTYIGFTVNPQRRIRQHNGEITSGAWRTKQKRPWEMILCIHGFPSNVSALQFEWAWQHPKESLSVRAAASSFKSLSGVANKIKLAYTMLTLPAWKMMNLTVNFFSTKYMEHIAHCPKLPNNMKTQVLPMDDLHCYTDEDSTPHEQGEDDEAIITESMENQSIRDISDSYSDFRNTEEELSPNYCDSPLTDRGKETLIAESLEDKIDDDFPENPVMKGEKMPTRRVEEDSFEFMSNKMDSEEPTKVLTPRINNEENNSFFINLLTPDSVKRGIHSCSRKLHSSYPLVIDLTDSPVIIHL